VNPPPVEIGILRPAREAAGDDGGGDQAEQLERATRELLPRLKG